jgi:hypothetical protein
MARAFEHDVRFERSACVEAVLNDWDLICLVAHTSFATALSMLSVNTPFHTEAVKALKQLNPFKFCLGEDKVLSVLSVLPSVSTEPILRRLILTTSLVSLDAIQEAMMLPANNKDCILLHKQLRQLGFSMSPITFVKLALAEGPLNRSVLRNRAAVRERETVVTVQHVLWLGKQLQLSVRTAKHRCILCNLLGFGMTKWVDERVGNATIVGSFNEFFEKGCVHFDLLNICTSHPDKFPILWEFATTTTDKKWTRVSTHFIGCDTGIPFAKECTKICIVPCKVTALQWFVTGRSVEETATLATERQAVCKQIDEIDSSGGAWDDEDIDLYYNDARSDFGSEEEAEMLD